MMYAVYMGVGFRACYTDKGEEPLKWAVFYRKYLGLWVWPTRWMPGPDLLKDLAGVPLVWLGHHLWGPMAAVYMGWLASKYMVRGTRATWAYVRKALRNLRE